MQAGRSGQRIKVHSAHTAESMHALAIERMPQGSAQLTCKKATGLLAPVFSSFVTPMLGGSETISETDNDAFVTRPERTKRRQVP